MLAGSGEGHAVSALAHDSAAVAADTAPTGVGTPDGPGDDGEAGEGGERRRTPKIVWILAGAALLVGATVGGLGAWLRNDDKPSSNTLVSTPRPSQRPVPTVTGSLPNPSSPPPPVFSDPKFAATITDLDDNGSSIKLTWTDPTKGKARYLVVDGQSREVLVQLDPGATAATITVKPEVRPRCFVITTLLDGRPRAASLPRCTATRTG